MKFFKAEKYKDIRGILMNATPMNPLIKNVMYITGKKGAIRGMHRHRKDTHYCLVIKGTICYIWKDHKNPKRSGAIDLTPGDIVLSEIGELHKFIFKTEGAFIAMATEARTQESYESDTIRENF